jgi:TRAP-type C4-dicarboxylate transport system permease small subunit
VKALERLSYGVNRVVEMALFTLGFGMAVIVAVQVFFRYVLNHSIFWSEELARFLLVWLTFLGASVAYHRRGHASIDVLFTRLSGPGRKAAALTVHLVCLGFFLILVIYGWSFAHFVRLQISPALSLPKWIPHGILPLSGAILTLHCLARLIGELAEKPGDH